MGLSYNKALTISFYGSLSKSVSLQVSKWILFSFYTYDLFYFFSIRTPESISKFFCFLLPIVSLSKTMSLYMFLTEFCSLSTFIIYSTLFLNPNTGIYLQILLFPPRFLLKNCGKPQKLIASTKLDELSLQPPPCSVSICQGVTSSKVSDKEAEIVQQHLSNGIQVKITSDEGSLNFSVWITWSSIHSRLSFCSTPNSDGELF